MSLPYPKPALSYRQQAEQLMARGLAIADLDAALERLRHCNYYRLGAYWLPFEADHATHRFKPGTSLEQVIRLYDADHALRRVVQEAIGQIEVSVRSQWAYQFGHAHGPHAHLDRGLARNAFHWERNMAALREEVGRSHEVFIRHLRGTYQEELPPIWAACEVMTFGLFSRWFANTGPMQVKKQVAASYGLSVPVLESWLRHLALVRNVCAHHARLWNREFTLTPEQPHRHPAEVASAFQPASRKLYNTLLILAHWSRYLPAAEPWRIRLVQALGHPSLDPGAMDFPADGRYAALFAPCPSGRNLGGPRMSLPRYPSYKDSGVPWLGQVPEHWQVLRLKHVCDAFPSNIDKKSAEGETPILLCNYTDVYYNENITAKLDFMEATATDDQIEKFELCAGDTIITKDSETPDDIAIAAYVPHDLPGVVCGYHLTMVRPWNDVDGAFIKRFFDSKYAKSSFAVRANGLTRYGLGQYAVDNIELPVPPCDEQKIIAAFLDHETAKIDALVAEQQRLLELLKEKRQAVISHAVTKGLNPDAPMKDSGVEWAGKIPVNWSHSRLAYACELIVDGTHFSPESYPEGEFRYITAKNIKETGFDFTESTYINAESHKEIYSRCPAKKDDILYIKDGATAGIAMINDLLEEFSLLSSVALIRPIKSALCEKFLVYQLNCHFFKEAILATLLGGAMTRFTLDSISRFTIIIPPIEEQSQIINFLDGVSKEYYSLVESSQHAIILLQERRAALISAAVTGQIDVRGWSPTEVS